MSRRARVDRPRYDFGASIGERIRSIRRERGLTQLALAEEAHVNQGYLSAIERGRRTPRLGTVRALAVTLGVPEGVLLGAGDGHDAPQALALRPLPLFGAIPNGPPAHSQEQLEMFPVLKHLWHPDRYCLRCEFDSMEPTLKRGDIILVEYRPDIVAEFVQGRICACLVEGQPTLKRVSVEAPDGERLIILRGDNPRTQPMVVGRGLDFSIQGIAISLVSRDL